MARASKGDRDIMVTRMPRVLGDEVRQRAADRGITLSDYIAGLLAADLGRPELGPAPCLDQELPMTG